MEARLKDGWIVEIRFYDGVGKPAPDAIGKYGKRIERNDLGFPEHVIFLGRDGKPKPIPGGIAPKTTTTIIIPET